MGKESVKIRVGICVSSRSLSGLIKKTIKAAGFDNFIDCRNSEDLVESLDSKLFDFLFLSYDFPEINKAFNLPAVLEKSQLNRIFYLTPEGRRIPKSFVRMKSRIYKLTLPVSKNEWELVCGLMAVPEDLPARKEKNDEKYKAFISHSSEAIWCFELETPISIDLPVEEQIDEFFKQGYLSDCNLSYAETYGFASPDEIMGIKLKDVLLPEDPANRAYLKMFIENGYKLKNAESVEIDKHGHKKYLLNNLDGVIQNGKIERAWGTQRDNTIIKNTENELLVTRNRYASIYTNALEGIYQSTLDGKLLSVNPAMAMMYGFSSPEEMMREVTDIAKQCYHLPQDRENFTNNLLAEGKVESMETVAVRKNGELFWTSENARLVQDTDTAEIHIEGLIENITKRKEAEASLKESEYRYRTLVDFSPEAVAVYSENEVVFVNHSLLTLMGAFRPDEILGKSPLQFVHPDSLPLVLERQKLLLKNIGQLPQVEEKFIRLDGSVIFVDVSSMSLLWKGKPAVQLIIRDVSERKREEMIRISESVILSMVAHSEPVTKILAEICRLNESFYPDSICAIYMFRQDQLQLIASPSLDKEFRKQIETIEKEGVAIACAKTKMPLYLHNLGTAEQWRSYRDCMSILGVQGCWAIPITDMRRSVYGVLFYYFPKPVVPNLLNERIAEHFVNLATIVIEKRRLEDENVILSSVAKQTTNAVSILDLDFKIVWVNEGYQKLTGFALEDVRDKNSFDLFSDMDPDGGKTKAAFEQIKSGIPVRFRTYRYSRDGRGFWDSVHFDLMYDLKNEHAGYIVIENDETETVLQEVALREAKERAEEASRLKSSFLANMSHEIRTPMNGILGFADILREELLAGEQHELYKFAETIYNSGKRLLNLLNDILDISRIEANKLDLEITKCRMEEIVMRVLTLLKPLAVRKGLELDYSGVRPAVAMADENRLFQVMNNVIGNAIKFTARGKVAVRCDEVVDEGNSYVELAVTDTGRGIEESFLQNIFEPFSQESSGYSRTHEGSGLGLAISQRLLVLMNGTIQISSKLNEGTTVSIRVPLAEGMRRIKNEELHYSPDPEDISLLRKIKPTVLVVEDDPTSKSYFQLIMNHLVDLQIAANGQEALSILEKMAAKKMRPDVILMDIGLPEPWDGIALKKEITKRYTELNSVPFIAQTAYAMKEERDSFVKAGFSGVIIKPINRYDLIKSVASTLTAKLP